MSSLNKLAIRGIRSFDDKQISVIEFFSPVTVIVGHNGSGKTTIIECLKYATTGDQPPNTRGGAFVHDPKMANEKEVKAQVKLRFNSASGTRMLAVRNLSVTVKKTGLTMKTLESILALADGSDKGGKRNAISTKCAEMDQEIPHLLGVSKAVLENVIFCHQEDSYWPLAEPSILKKKFDDIFEATKYTKALDSIKSLRKERVADLKAEKERLESLAREKSHSDKLRSRITALAEDINAKQAEHDETKREHDELVIANAKFRTLATNFEQTYMQAEQYAKEISRLTKELDDAKENMRELEGTDEELSAKLTNSDDDIRALSQKLHTQRNKQTALEREIESKRHEQEALSQRLGAFKAEHEAQLDRLKDREQLIHATSDKFKIKGFSHDDLDAENITQFTTQLKDLYTKQMKTVQTFQTESSTNSANYTRKHAELSKALAGHKAQKEMLSKQVNSASASIREAEGRLESMESLTSEVASKRGDIEEKQARRTKQREELDNAKFEQRIAEKASAMKLLEERRDKLSLEFKTLNLQAEARAKLKVHRTDIENKTAEISTIIGNANPVFRRQIGSEADASTMEREVERVYREKVNDQDEIQGKSLRANNDLQTQQGQVSNLKKQLKVKREELKGVEKKIVEGLDEPNLDIDEQIQTAREELEHRVESASSSKFEGQAWEAILKEGKRKKICTACNRHLEDHEMADFERHLKEKKRKATNATAEELQEEVEDWRTRVQELQDMKPHILHRNRLRDVDVPALELQVKDIDKKIPDLKQEADELAEKLDDLKRDISELQQLKTHAVNIARLKQEIKRAKDNAATLEEQLKETGSTKSSEDVQNEIDDIGSEIRKNDKQREQLVKEKETRNSGILALERAIHTLEVEALKLANQLEEKQRLEKSIETHQTEMADCQTKIKAVEAQIAKAQGPIDDLKTEHDRIQIEVKAKIDQAQTLYQELRAANDRLESTNKGIESYVRARKDQQWKDARETEKELRTAIVDENKRLDEIRKSIAATDKEMGAQDSYLGLVRENLRIRGLVRLKAETEEAQSNLDIESAAKARRTFESRYTQSMTKEADMHTKFSQLAGELSSERAQLKEKEKDLREFKDINKKYTDQLIQVKMSDMANNDLEKYAKALDNAIMKYHSLKMDEVNETMKHLWNKTYQGSDIDGIRIASDSEGGTTKRSYNYRVVMKKEQVEMDMRGRCSAGQKMLASIIIRLALSDSFGQNCGILALDEPTNALDTENIDALAESLVDIIKERKGNANFQLIIITHDESFLRKLGQSEVMEYYWRVSRDNRQKSVIERQRFR
ncbi:AAA-23 domain-containing protein [Mycena kentingensis (nom. inval.)]|nr:AAA-23 domain-containing protein [Mycena kentingensis (nom. inval.)]